MRNFPEWSIAFWAAAAAGAVVVPLNAWWTGAELEYGLADSGSPCWWPTRSGPSALAGAAANLPAFADVFVAGRGDGGAHRTARPFADALGEVDR